MSRQKSHLFRPPLYHRHESAGSGSGGVGPGASPAVPQVTDSERQSWDAYRRWLARTGDKAPVERTPLDPSIYSWKGYNNWADRIRQNWNSDDKDQNGKT